VRGVREQALGLAAAAATVVALAAVAGCGSEEDEASGGGEEQTALLGPRPGKLTCTEWNEGTREERLGTIGQLTELAGANANPEEIGPNRTMSDDDAYDALEGTCEHDLARGFLLYEVYNRAAAFDLEGLEDLEVPES
jgi:hypothetical protein